MRIRVEDLSWREVDGSLVILDLRSSKYLTANPSAALLMKMLATDRTADELVQAMVDAFGIDRSQAQLDLDKFLEVLARNQLLEPV